VFSDVVGNLCRWNLGRILDGFQGEERNHDRHWNRVRLVMAVSRGPACHDIVLTATRRDTQFTYFPHTDDGNARFDFFKQVVAFHPIRDILAAQNWDLTGTSASQFALALVTFLYVDIIDCTATLYSMAKFCGVVEDNGDFPRSTVAYCTDAACISIGSLFGCSPVTAFIESGAGIAEGGRTGLTAIVTGLCFLISLFFAPILTSIPPWSTGSTLVLVSHTRPSALVSRLNICDRLDVS
jgi:adenine/guanine/hypoxanthine permease